MTEWENVYWLEIKHLYKIRQPLTETSKQTYKHIARLVADATVGVLDTKRAVDEAERIMGEE